MTFAGSLEPAPLAWSCDESDLALLMYTGGTTGRPKGVMQPHRSIVTNVMLALAEWELGEAPLFLGCAPLSHGLAPHGAADPAARRDDGPPAGFDPDAVLDAIVERRVTTTFWCRR